MKNIKIILLIIFFLYGSVNAEIIKDVKVENNKRVSKESIIAFGNIELGSDYNEGDINNILIELYNTNFFSDIKLKVENGILIVDVKEKKIIQSILIEGIKSKENTTKILKQLKLKDKSPFDKFTAEQDINKIKNALNRSGYYFATVDAKIIENNNDTLDIIYTIETGEKALIKNIKFTGDKYYKDRKLRNAIVSEENKFWKFISKKKYLDIDRIELDKRLLKNFYLNKGFYNVEIESSSAVFNDNFFELIYNINAGNKYFIEEVKLDIPIDYNPKDFKDVQKSIEKLKNAKYSWIAFLDSDDAWHKKKLKTQMDSIIQENNAYRLIHTDETWFRNGEHINQMKKHKKDGGDIFKKCLDLCCISPSSVLVKKEVFDDLGYFDESLPACEDYDMWLRITSNEPVYFINELLTIKNGGHKDQLSKKYWGLDRFRVQSLEKIIFQNILNDNQKGLAYGVLIKKLKILINGAKKRNNQTVIKVYDKKYDQWKTFPYNFLNQEKNEK